MDYLAGQLEIADVSCGSLHMERPTARVEHTEDVKLARGLRDLMELVPQTRSALRAAVPVTVAPSSRWMAGSSAAATQEFAIPR